MKTMLKSLRANQHQLEARLKNPMPNSQEQSKVVSLHSGKKLTPTSEDLSQAPAEVPEEAEDIIDLIKEKEAWNA
ncbi:OLC1v1016007C1, partial [Oldenlandia corymbosa var. corymbosa]